jgi:hypothetical protein
MKKILFPLLAILTCFCVQAQSPIIEGTYLPVRNTSIKQLWDTVAGDLSIPTPGPDQVWDYSNQFTNLTDTFTTRTFDIDSTPYQQYFPEANQALYWNVPLDQDSLWVYLTVDTAGIYRVGAFSEQTIYDTTVTNNPRELIMPMNVYYNMDTINNYSYSLGHGNVSGIDVKLVAHKWKDVTGAGYGTLSTPLGTFDDVVLMKEDVIELDTIYIKNLQGAWQVFQTYNNNSIYYHYLRNNTFASTHLMLMKCDPTNSINWYGWYTIPVDYGSIMGTVYDTTGAPTTNGDVLLYREYSNFTKNDILARTKVNTSGQYQFDSIPHGEYRIASRPDLALYPNAITTYYGDTTNWIICPTVITTSDTTLGTDIHILYHPEEEGTSSITGNVQLNLGINKTGSRAGDPIPGLDISLEQIPGGIIASQSGTDSTGHFEMGNLNNGDYELFVDIPGLHMSGTYAFTVANGDVVTELNFVVGMDSIHPTSNAVITASSIDEGNQTQSFAVYPNPFNSKINIEVAESCGSIVAVSVFNVAGQLITNKQYKLGKAGINKINWDAADLPTGMYLLTVESDRDKQSYKIVKR